MKNISIDDLEESLSICCGENRFRHYEVNADNWVRTRNEFLSNVSYNGARSHEHIIIVLQWFSQFTAAGLIMSKI